MAKGPFASTRRALAWSTVSALVLLAAACGDDSDDDEASSDTTEPATETTEPADDATTTTTEPASDVDPEDQEVIDAFGEAVSAGNAAYDPPDPTDPDLHATSAGESLDRALSALRDLRDQGMSTVLEAEWSAKVASRTSADAVLEVCMDETWQTVDTDSREPQDEGGDIVKLEVTMSLIDDVWKQTLVELLEGSCEVE